MAGYIIARVNVTDPEKYQDYTAVTPGLIAKHGGRFIVRGGETATLEGPEETGRIVVIEFDSLEQAKAMYESAEYQAAIKLRAGAATAQFLAVAGV
ncbi:MAG: DUF1330 domain-containing protein [Alphaproteobacteria bacterium]|nr:DUF1330 domain-containing protein [Alphaproteobacteria bacterium]